MNLSKLFSAFSGKLDEKIFIDGFASTPLPSYHISAFERFFWLCVLVGCFMGLSSLAKGQSQYGSDLRRYYTVTVANTPKQKLINREDLSRKVLKTAKTFRCGLKYQITKEGVYSPAHGFEIVFTPADNWLSFGSGESYTVSSYEIFKSHETNSKILMSCSLGVFQFYKKNGEIYRMVFVSNDLKEKYILSNDIVLFDWKY